MFVTKSGRERDIGSVVQGDQPTSEESDEGGQACVCHARDTEEATSSGE